MKPFASWKQAAIVIGIALPLLAGAATATPGSAPDAAAPGVGSAELPQSDYRLGGGDTIRITVFQIPDLTLETRVGESGEMSYPNIGKVKVGGLTLGDAADEIAKQLDRHEIAKHPQVSITLLQVRGNQVSVLGQVNRPGRIQCGDG
jgi:polysaccharide export outer membrane protein